MSFIKKNNTEEKERNEKAMTIKMYSIKDELNGYTTPIPIASEELAKRYFKEQVITNPTIKNSKEDFSLWKLGEFNPKTGEYKNETPELVERAQNYE